MLNIDTRTWHFLWAVWTGANRWCHGSASSFMCRAQNHKRSRESCEWNHWRRESEKDAIIDEFDDFRGQVGGMCVQGGRAAALHRLYFSWKKKNNKKSRCHACCTLQRHMFAPLPSAIIVWRRALLQKSNLRRWNIIFRVLLNAISVSGISCIFQQNYPRHRADPSPGY